MPANRRSGVRVHEPLMATCLGILAWSGRAVAAGAMMLGTAALLLVVPPWRGGRPAGSKDVEIEVRIRVYFFTAVGVAFIVFGLLR